MPPPPSLCGSFLTNKRSLVAFTWSLTTVLTLVAFILAIVMTAHVHGRYVRMERYYEALLEYNHEQQQQQKQQQQQNGNNNGQQQQRGGSADNRELEYQLQLGRVSSRGMALTSLFTAMTALGLSLYGSTTIVGFTSMRGVYIAPCFSPDPLTNSSSHKLKIGMFGGAIVLFANLLLLCSILLGEVRVEDWTNHNRKEDNNNNNNGNNNNNKQQEPWEPYEIERIATILAVTCMFLAPLYIIFAVLLFFYYGGDSAEDYSLQDGSAGLQSTFYIGDHHDSGTTTPRGGHQQFHYHPHHHSFHHHHHNGLHPPGPGIQISNLGTGAAAAAAAATASGVVPPSIHRASLSRMNTVGSAPGNMGGDARSTVGGGGNMSNNPSSSNNISDNNHAQSSSSHLPSSFLIPPSSVGKPPLGLS